MTVPGVGAATPSILSVANDCATSDGSFTIATAVCCQMMIPGEKTSLWP
jgi:hypothetical protein